jgi:hypothetical protein
VSSLSSSTEREDDRVSDKEMVYRDSEEARDGELWKVCSSGG